MGGPAADEDAESDFLAIGPGNILQFAEPDLHRGGSVAGREGVGGVGAGPDGGINQGGDARLGFTDFEHRGGIVGRVPKASVRPFR